MKVLLIEDDPILQEMFRDEFKKNDFQLISTTNGKAGIIEAAKEHPDFILLDIMLPGINGITTFKHLKEMPQTRDIPVAFLTVVPEGVPQSLDHNPEMLKGAVGYWPKDKYNPIEIVAMIKKYLNVGS